MNSLQETLPSWARAHGRAVTSAELKSTPADFEVVEHLSFEASGTGEHELLRVRKTGANTLWVARQLARHAGIPVRDVGYAGLKDRQAVTTQYFSIRCPGQASIDWSAFAASGVEILESARHDRKLRRGAHAANTFVVVARTEKAGDRRAAIEERWIRVAETGVPNYFGNQRFGRDSGNISLARDVLGGRRVRREQRSIALSAARALLFNAILSARVLEGTWNRVLAGDVANLDGSGSVFAVDDASKELDERSARFDIHPTGSLWGTGAPCGCGAVAESERRAVGPYSDIADGLVASSLKAASRALRVRPADTQVEFDDDRVRLGFRLPPGAFATSVLREVFSDR